MISFYDDGPDFDGDDYHGRFGGTGGKRWQKSGVVVMFPVTKRTIIMCDTEMIIGIPMYCIR